MPVRWGLTPTGHSGFFFCTTILLGRATCYKPTQGKHTKRTGKNSFTNFSEISYEKTRGSYDRSEIAARKQKFLLAHQSGLPVEQAAKAATACSCSRSSPTSPKPVTTGSHPTRPNPASPTRPKASPSASLLRSEPMALGPMPTDPPSPPPASACYTPAAIQRTSTPRRERRHDNDRRSRSGRC